MPKGGKRAGAGRRKGSVNRASAALREAVVASGQELPLDYMLRVMREAEEPTRRDDMAKAAAPYVHAKLASIEHTGKDGGPMTLAFVSGFDVSSSKD